MVIVMFVPSDCNRGCWYQERAVKHGDSCRHTAVLLVTELAAQQVARHVGAENLFAIASHAQKEKIKIKIKMTR